ncbi:MAG: hypothetical protein ACXVZ3_14630 [Gaiellaceae bacterium]
MPSIRSYSTRRLSRHYSPELLASAEARRSLVAPDLEPVPWEAGPGPV